MAKLALHVQMHTADSDSVYDMRLMAASPSDTRNHTESPPPLHARKF
jgi:hypothetical protein